MESLLCLCVICLHVYFKRIFSCIGLSCEEITRVRLPKNVQEYTRIVMKQYKEQDIVVVDWPPRVGQDFFGRLALVEKKNFVPKKEHDTSSWHLLRGEVDKIPKLPGHTEIEIENILQPDSPDVVIIDGPPGIGKTTLCRKILEMWSNGECSQYDLVLYCPLREITAGSELIDLLNNVYEYKGVTKVSEWIEELEGKGLLIIFDGWDELSKELRQDSLPAKIVRRKRLSECSVIVTSRSYASASLLKMVNKCRHVQVIGFSKNEINTVIIKTLQSDQSLAQDLIDRVNGLPDDDAFLDLAAHESSESRLAAKLINNLKMRSDVQSLCYVPLVCSMVILVYNDDKNDKDLPELPPTLTKLYENFVLKTIERHVERYYDDEEFAFDNLSELPSQLATPFKELCKLSYENLVKEKMTFTSSELQQSLKEGAVKEKYLGMMTTIRNSRKENHQFLHLSIQEFLAAWWMTHYEDERSQRTEELFNEKFDDDHFRMCLRFVAGLTQLKNVSYRQYFNRKFNVSSKRKHFALEHSLFSHFYHESPNIRSERMGNDCMQSVDTDNLSVLLLQLVHESQNNELCKLVAESLNYDACLYEVTSSLFDVMCLFHFVCNSNAAWKQLSLGYIYGFAFSGFYAGLEKMSTDKLKCTELGLLTKYVKNEVMMPLTFVLSLYKVQTFHFVLHDSEVVPSYVLSQILQNMPQLEILHLSICYPEVVEDSSYDAQVEECITANSTLNELKIVYSGYFDVSSTINSIIRGVARNKTLRSFTLEVESLFVSLQGTTIEELVGKNMILKALSLNIPDSCLSSPLNISGAVNIPLTALEIGRHNTELMTSILPHVKGLNCLSLPYPDKIYQLPELLPYPDTPYQLLICSHPNLQQLTLPLNKAETASELCTILQTNNTLQGLKMEIENELVFTEGMNISLKDMLKQNKTLQFLEIITPSCISSNVPDFPVPTSFLSHVTAGLSHNTSLKQLGLPITLPVNEQVKTFFDVITQKGNLTDIQVYYLADQSCSNCSVEEKKAIMTPLFYEQGLPVISGMLQLHATINLRLECEYLDESEQPNWEEPTTNFCESVYLHPSLEYLEIIGFHPLSNSKSMLESYLEEKKGDLAKRRRQEEPLKLMPKVNIARKYLYYYN